MYTVAKGELKRMERTEHVSDRRHERRREHMAEGTLRARNNRLFCREHPYAPRIEEYGRRYSEGV